MNQKQDNFKQLKLLQKLCVKQNIAFVSYKSPHDQEITTLVQHLSAPEKLENLNDLNNKTGFIISPFSESPTNRTYLLKPDNVFFSDDIDDSYIKMIADSIRSIKIKKNEVVLKEITKEHFTNNVIKAINDINIGELQKVVLSKAKKLPLPDNFEPSSFFLNLCNNYPHAFVYFLKIPEVGCWLGASPEPLLTIENKLVNTVSLAGTQIANNIEINNYQWSTKELEEQKIVTDFVENTLINLNIDIYKKKGPFNYQAANLIHLKTTFEFSEKSLNNRYGDFLKALHPTPSVGGLPKTKAAKFISNNENYDRSYYTGFLGPINIIQKSAIFVNLRCLQLFDNEFVLYSGAGITASSIAEKEWEETENKILTLLNVMIL
jgi:isochorismate synthase